MERKTTVLIIGAGPAGLATSACLNLKNIPNIVLEKEDCYASLWKKKTYDRLKLHLAKQFCELPHFSYPSDASTFIPKTGFIQYLDNYVSHFNINPFCNRLVVSASFDQNEDNWVVVSEDVVVGTREKWVAKFLVVATGENSQGFIPQIPGLDSYKGEILHSSSYINGRNFRKRDVLVVGCGNSGMEIALDLSNWGAQTSIVVRGPVHCLNEDMVKIGMTLLKYQLPLELVDKLLVFLSRFKYGDLSGYGLKRPDKGPFYLKKETGRSPVLDVGTIDKIRAHEIQVFPGIKKVSGNHVHFENGDQKTFDAILFATGYKSTVTKWLEDDGGLFNENGMPKNRAPNHWKGRNGLYCVGFASAGLNGISKDAKAAAEDINAILGNQNWE